MRGIDPGIVKTRSSAPQTPSAPQNATNPHIPGPVARPVPPASSQASAASPLPEALQGLCDRCLGRRLIGAAGEAPQTKEGRKHREAAGGTAVAPTDCRVCEDAFADFEEWVRSALEALEPYEFATFQAGTVFPTECEQAEKDAAAALEMDVGETIRTEANRLLAPRIEAATGATVEPGGRPDIAVTVDTRFWSAEARANSVFVLGRYTKHSREIPQTHWPCKRCQGRGCWECDDVGVLYTSSVEDVIASFLQPAFGASGVSFHGAGREDIDALMLGTGRPFVLELHDPKKRTVDFGPVEEALHAAKDDTGVDATELRMAEKDDVARIKNTPYQKEYLAHCLTEAPVTAEAVQAAADTMTGTTLQQRTPQRVAHRRADKVRERTVEHVIVETPPDDAGTRFSLRVLAESGTYIKEMVSSDDGRTDPSFAGLLGVPCTVEWLDVVAILDRE